MITNDEMQKKIAEIVGRLMPSAEIVRVRADAITDSDDSASLRVLVITRQRPPKSEISKLVEVADEFRTWLVGRGDERFPYLRLLSEDEEQQIQRMES